MNKRPKKKTKKGSVRRNVRPVFLLLLIPLAIGATTAVAVASGLYRHNLADFGNRRLVTEGWEGARQTMEKAQPQYERKFAYYKVKEGEDAASLAAHFSVDQKKLTDMNPGIFAAGTTIKVPPLEKPLSPKDSNGRIKQALVTEDKGIVRVSQKSRLRQPIVTNIPELAELLAPQKVFEKTGPSSWRITRPVSIDGDIRVDVTAPTVTKIELASTPDNVTCFCFDQSEALFKGVEVTSYVPSTGLPDPTFADGRSFLRMKNGRMDLLDSSFSYLGNALDGAALGDTNESNGYLKEGGVYGVSWRISSDTLGENLTTGWVEHSSFQHNHFGTYSFGASGMMWKDSYFAYNDIYGLDPHDDSNNAMVVGNVFEHNGKHGFIVSKRCNYNIIRDNLSMDNKLHGYMLHQDSAYNLIEDNISYGNEDGYVVYESNYTTIRNNKSFAARSAHVRINRPSNNSYITGNQLIGGKRGIFLYDGVKNTLINDNAVHQVNKALQTEGAGNTILSANKIDALLYDIDASDSDGMIFGVNSIESDKDPLPSASSVRQNFLASHPNTRRP